MGEARRLDMRTTQTTEMILSFEKRVRDDRNLLIWPTSWHICSVCELLDDRRDQAHYQDQRDYEVRHNSSMTRNVYSRETERTMRSGLRRTKTVDKSLRFEWAVNTYLSRYDTIGLECWKPVLICSSSPKLDHSSMLQNHRTLKDFESFTIWCKT